MTEHEKKIVEAAEKARDWWVNGKTLVGGPVSELIDAVNAKRESERPKLMTAEEAVRIFYIETPATREQHMQPVLDACLDRAMLVVRALPSAPRSNLYDVPPTWGAETVVVSVEDIRRALRPGASS